MTTNTNPCDRKRPAALALTLTLAGALAALAAAGEGLVACSSSSHAAPAPQQPPAGSFVSIADVDPSIIVEARYFGAHNFLGTPVRGYGAPKCVLTVQAATALAEVQKELTPFGLSLKVYDCYRPQRAVDHFVEWAKDLSDVKMKKEFYPNVDKANLFRDGYIAEKSGHSRGSTMDLTVVPVPAPEQEAYVEGAPLRECYLPSGERFGDNSLNMGTGFDCFDLRSHTLSPDVNAEQRGHRLLLKALMEKHNFRVLKEEWWHFTLNDEPFPDTFFDFEIL